VRQAPSSSFARPASSVSAASERLSARHTTSLDSCRASHLPYQLKAQTSYEIGPDGARCTITLPVSARCAGIG
jgi:hypothetical protein